MRELEKGLVVGVKASTWSLRDRFVEGAFLRAAPGF